MAEAGFTDQCVYCDVAAAVAFIYLKLSKLCADVGVVSPSYVVFFTGSLGLGPKELWGKCHPATLQIKARKRGAHSTAVGQERIPILLLPALVIVSLGGY